VGTFSFKVIQNSFPLFFKSSHLISNGIFQLKTSKDKYVICKKQKDGKGRDKKRNQHHSPVAFAAVLV
jgi:hypothetical protein